jgi:hypothetical protein
MTRVGRFNSVRTEFRSMTSTGQFDSPKGEFHAH